MDPPGETPSPEVDPKKLKKRPEKLKLKSEAEQMVACAMLAEEGDEPSGHLSIIRAWCPRDP